MCEQIRLISLYLKVIILWFQILLLDQRNCDNVVFVRQYVLLIQVYGLVFEFYKLLTCKFIDEL